MVVHLTAAPFGCGRDLYIHMRPELVKGKSGVQYSWDQRKGHSKNTLNRDLLLVQQQRRKHQTDVIKRLSTPSQRQINTLVEFTNKAATKAVNQLEKDLVILALYLALRSSSLFPLSTLSLETQTDKHSTNTALCSHSPHVLS